MRIRLVFCIDNPSLQKELQRHLENEDVLLEFYGRVPNPWQKIIRSGADIIIVSQSMMPDPVESSIALLNELPETPTTVILYEGDSYESQIRWVASGADLALPFRSPPKSLAEAILTVIESRKQYAESISLGPSSEPNPALGDFAAQSDLMNHFLQEVNQILKSSLPLLLLGETGVGKEHLARAIHYESPRSNHPFIAVNMAAIPESLLESELFGHVQGAFTGATRSYRGAFEQAHRGTIFLDEIGEMPLHLQTKLLRTLQDYEVKPLGGESPLWVDVRVIGATNRDLETEIERGNFRKDLYYRLSVLPLKIPPLRERPEDIVSVIERFCESRRFRYGNDITITDRALEVLSQYDWPGNVRELFNVLERAIILCGDGSEIDIIHLPKTFSDKLQPDPQTILEDVDTTGWEEKTLSEVLDQSQAYIEQRYLRLILTRTKGRLGEAARLAGIHPRTLYNKMQKLGLSKEEFKSPNEKQ